MNGRLIILRTDGTRTETEIIAAPSLNTLQQAVGGYIEAISYFNLFEGQRCAAFCNENGKLEGLPPNQAATAAWHYATPLAISDELVGDIVIVAGDNELLAAL